jgi:L-rhamnonate dehydratase
MEFTSATPVTGLILQTFIEYLLAPLLIGQDPSDTAMLWQRMYWNGLLRRGGDGLMRNANAAVDFALWDIKGNAMALPVWRLLGGLRSTVPTYGRCAENLPPDKLAERAAEYFATGHCPLKIRGTRAIYDISRSHGSCASRLRGNWTSDGGR